MLKKQGFISFTVNAVVGIIIALICFYLMILPALNDNATYKQIACVYSDSAYDFVAPSPIKEQIEEIKSQSSVKSVYEYYLFSASVSTDGKSIKTDAMFSESDNLGITPFNETRLISGNDGEDALYVTDSVAKALNAEIGDEATVSIFGKSAKFKIGKIFLDDDGKNGKVIFRLTDSVKNAIFNEEMALSGVYIEANDVAAVKNYLNSYIPMGRLLTRDYFDSDLQYNSYVEEFMSQNYSSVINDKSVLEEVALRVNEDYLTDSEDTPLKSALVVGGIMFAVAILNLVAILAYGKLRTLRSGHMIGFTRKTIILFTMFSWVAFIFCALTFGILFSLNTSGMLFVNSFNSKIIGFNLLFMIIGETFGVLIDFIFCKLSSNLRSE